MRVRSSTQQPCMNPTGQTQSEEYTDPPKRWNTGITVHQTLLDLSEAERAGTQADCKFHIVSLELPTFYYYRNRKRQKDVLARGGDPPRGARTAFHVTHKLRLAAGELTPLSIHTVSLVPPHVIRIAGTSDTNKSRRGCLTFLFYKPLQFSDYESVIGSSAEEWLSINF